MKTKNLICFFLFALLIIPSLASAHQPRVVESRETIVVEPEISKAYYGTLTGTPDTYTIQSDTPFDLYVNVLAPKIDGQKKDVSARILKDGELLIVLDGDQHLWTEMFEPFGHDTYWQGPEYRMKVGPGTYVITVTSGENDSKYSLAIGEAEKFDFKETLNALTLVPLLKRDFFNESPIDFILSPLGFGMIVVLYILAAIFGLAYRFVLRKIAKKSVRKVGKNIDTRGRLIRFLIGIALLLLAITTVWDPITIFFSGFALFEAAFSWCGLYAAMGKNTCPIE